MKLFRPRSIFSQPHCASTDTARNLYFLNFQEPVNLNRHERFFYKHTRFIRLWPRNRSSTEQFKRRFHHIYSVFPRAPPPHSPSHSFARSFSPMFFQRRGRGAHSLYSTADLDSQNESSGREDENDYDSSCGSLYGEPVGHKNGATDFYNTPLMIAASHRFPCSL